MDHLARWEFYFYPKEERGWIFLRITWPSVSQIVVHLRVKSITGDYDPYKEVKKKQNELALKYESTLSAQIAEMSDPLKAAMMFSAAGNAIDLAPDCPIPDIYKRYMEIISKGFARDDYELFLKKLARSKSLLYLGDNAGEIVWDKILIEELVETFDVDITYAVKGFPIINDVTMEDAHFVGLDKVVKVVSNGFDAPGTLLDKWSEEFLKKYQKVDLILSKGLERIKTKTNDCRCIDPPSQNPIFRRTHDRSGCNECERVEETYPRFEKERIDHLSYHPLHP